MYADSVKRLVEEAAMENENEMATREDILDCARALHDRQKDLGETFNKKLETELSKRLEVIERSYEARIKMLEKHHEKSMILMQSANAEMFAQLEKLLNNLQVVVTVAAPDGEDKE